MTTLVDLHLEQLGAAIYLRFIMIRENVPTS
jgi:hypothetical protein